MPGEGNGNPLQYSWPEKPTDRGAWQDTVQGVSRWTRLKQLNHHQHQIVMSKYVADRLKRQKTELNFEE